MQSTKLKWSDLKVGVVSVVAVVVLVAIIFKVGTNEKLFSTKYTLRTFVPNVQNLTEGGLVSLSGIKVGTVRKLELTQRHGKNGVMIWLEIDRAYRDKITSSSVARIMTLGILGDKYVDITQGQSGEQPLNQGDFLKGVIPLDFGELTDIAVATLEDLNAILVSGKSITHKIDQGEGFLGALLNDPQLARDMHRLLSSTSDLLMAMKSSEGSLGLFLHDSTVYNNLASITNSFSDITMKILEGEGFLGKLIADPSLYANLESLTAQADSLVYNMSNRGTTGRFLTDDQVYEEVAQLLNDMQTLMQDVKSHPRKYINLKVF